MRFRILGPVEVWTGRDWDGIGAPRWRALLAALLLSRGQPVSTDQLIAELWGDGPPDRAANLVSVYMLRLRRLIGDAEGQVLIARAPGYQLLLDPGDLDAERFEVLAGQGRLALVAGDSIRAAEVLVEALGLWRGPALADVPPSALVTAQASRLEESRLAALELRIQADMGCGLHAQMVPELRSLLSDHPLREGLWSLLIQALDGAGRDAEALAAYGQARQAISDELGVDPGPELQRLYQAMLAADRIPQRRLAGSSGSSAIESPFPQVPDRGDGPLSTANYDVFISHAVADTATARRLAEQLSSLDLQVFLDVDRIRIDDDWEHIISQALEGSSAIAVILSSNTSLSGYATREISYASANARVGRSLLIPLYLDEQSAHNVPRDLEKFQGVQAFDFSQLEFAAQKIADAVRDAEPIPLVPEKISGNIPLQPADYVTTSTVDDVIRVVTSSLDQARGPVQVIGPPGIGKTTAVAEACRRLRTRFSVICWLRSGSAEDIADDLVALGNSLKIYDTEPTSPHRYASATVRHLESTTTTWCLVFDEVGTAEDLSRWIPDSTNVGTSILISRHQLPWTHDGLSYRIRALNSAESARYLQAQLSAVAGESLDDQTLTSIAEKLGGSPLLLTLAGRYLAQSVGPTTDRAGQLLELASDSPLTVDASIERSLSRIAASAAIANRILHALGWLANAPFPLKAILQTASDPYLSSSQRQVSNAIEALRIAGLINVNLGQLQVHDLVKRFARERSGPPAIAFLARSIKESLDELPDAPPENATAFAAHVTQMLGEVDRLDDYAARNNVLQIAVQIARRLGQGGLHEDEARILEQTLAASERILGPDHPSSLSVRANLASVYQELGRREDAVALLEQTLAASERILGPDHPSSLSVRANLAYARRRPEGSHA